MHASMSHKERPFYRKSVLCSNSTLVKPIPWTVLNQTPE